MKEKPQDTRFEAIVLAGGAGRRFGGHKLTSSYRGGLLIEGALHTAMAAPVWRTTVVTGFDAKGVQAAVAAFAQRRCPDKNLQFVNAEDHSSGMAATLRCGLRSVSPETHGAFIFLGDMPEIPEEIPHRLKDALGDALAAAPVFQGRRGHPVLIRRELFAGLNKLEGDVGARGLLDDLGAALALVNVSAPGVLIDVDQCADHIA